MDYVIEMLDITKEFPGIKANDSVTLQVRDKEVHALLGENGAGKSTLMSVLFGLYQPEKGIIKVNGQAVKIQNPNMANDLGIGMVHQHFKLIENYTVTENIILGQEPKLSFGRVDMQKARQQVQQLSDQYGLRVDPDAKIEDITVGMQQRVEILKVLYRQAEILILDEPTAVLTPQEINELMKIIRLLVEEGKSVILITHKLEEIKKVADRCTVLRKGKYVGTIDVKDTSEQEMAEMMVGRDVNFGVEKGPYQPKEVVLEVKNLVVENSRKMEAIKNISFDVHRGEILCIAGIDGNGQKELIEAIVGLTPIKSGSIRLNGKELNPLSIRQRTETGIGHIPEDRHKYGLVLDFNLEENLALQNYYQHPLAEKGLIQFKTRESFANRLIEEFDVRSGSGSKSIARQMSGGNQQKAIIAREVDRSPDLLIAAQPTRGLDVGAIEYIHRRLVEERDKGKAVLLISLELDEVLNLPDTIAVLFDGQIVGRRMANETDENELGLMMSGSKTDKGNENV